ncbi:hypothetical protein UXP18_02600 [Enterobacter asburiae]|uniref:hypothetical protein n=1 Tax=Enterobacter asburiae TaxID=61645 RepID=UPI002FD17F5B
MSNIDKHAVQAVADLKAGYTLGHADVAILNELARIALASLEAEPVAWLLSGGGAKNHVSFDSGNAYADPLREVTPLYTAPPAPVPVPAAMEMDDDFDSAFEHGKAVGWNACRAAMLQAGNHTEQHLDMVNSPVIPDGWAMVPKEPAPGMINAWLSEVANFRGHAAGYRAALAAAPDFREIVNSSTNNFRENAETSTKCWCHTCRPVTISDMRFVVCPECGNKRCPKANDHRHSCTGSNEPGQEGSAYPAAPQQEA